MNNTIRWLRYTAILLWISLFISTANAQTSQKITFGATNITLKKAFNELEKLSGMTISYNNSQLDDQQKINLPKAERTVAETLRLLLHNQSLTIKQTDARNILLVNSIKGKLTGKITDQNTEPIPGVSVKILETAQTIQSNNDGNYSINLEPGTYTIITKYISFEDTRTEKVKITANHNTVLNLHLQESTNALNEVVVTALGIKREEKALGYSTKVLKTEQLTDAMSNNWTDALSGKVAGLNLIRSNGGPAGSNKIILRGESNLTGENDALIVVDGVVINHGSGRTTGSGSSAYLQSESPIDFGSGLNDINPDDIENVTVLKGPGAAALYGQRGANGAIIITTKSGKKRNGIGVTINSNTAVETISRWPDYQYEYGQGNDGASFYSFGATEDGPSTRSTSSAWGPKFNGQSFFQYDPITKTAGTVRTPWVPYKNARKEFFESGRTFTNSVTLDGGNDKTTFRLSLTNVDNKWIIPNTGYGRNTVALSATHKVNDKLQVATKVNYTNKFSDNLPSTGYNNQSIMYWNMFWLPSADTGWLKDYWAPGKENVLQSYPFSSYPDNPYLIAHEMLNKSNRNALTGNVQATYNFSKNLSLMVRSALDFSYDARSQQRPFDTEKFKKGMYRTQNIFSQEISNDFLIRYQKDIHKDIKISVSTGGSMLRNTYNKDELRADSLTYPGIYSLANSAGVLTPKPYRGKYGINSFYGVATASYKDYLFLDITGRNDWNSVLATAKSTDNVSFFYPSVNLSAIVSEMFKLPEFISYAKVRTSVAGVGSGQQTPYITSFTYDVADNYPGGLQNPTVLTNTNLKPLYTTSYEVGTDLRFFKNRLGVNIALYKSDTKDQILKTTVDRSSGVSYAYVNAGKVRNQGVEIELNGTPIAQKDGFKWTVFGTFTANRNKIIALTESLDNLILQSGPASRGAIVAKVGGSMGDLYGRGYKRSPDGQIVYNNGYPVIPDDQLYIGNTNPKWKASLGNQFHYKNFSASFLVDAQYGAVGYSLTAAVLAEQGKTTNTIPGRYNGIIGKGVVQQADGSYSPNTVIAQDMTTYYTTHYGRDNIEGSTYSTDFLKLREARFDYTFKPKTLRRIGLQRATIGVYGRDLMTITKWPGFDPEFGTLNDGTINQGFELGQFPSTRTFGINLTIGI
ncbi:SusC/RagA family TonB-linked outer membrane protein [Pedobacter lusitanus]|uniref:SusC/RagA family TonB-linked outer membrane protein n=1 Tax=Pedobacter lusitanus TaxID=1503925 RepID=UPI00069876A9|nr:SusC/RagA family TonB-linked outer membrane protein [Pedobacter lusitanus]